MTDTDTKGGQVSLVSMSGVFMFLGVGILLALVLVVLEVLIAACKDSKASKHTPKDVGLHFDYKLCMVRWRD